MIITKTPFRISFAGGGSDLPSFYREHGGAVISTSIDKYMFITINRKFDNRVRLSYSITEEVESASDIQHPIVRHCLQNIGIEKGVEIVSVSDIPSSGTGLGSSSAFTVGLLQALSAFKSEYVTKDFLGAEASRVEIEQCGEPIGKQDQYAASFGGLNHIKFREDDSVEVEKIILSPANRSKMNQNLMMFYTGMTRSASGLLAEQNQLMKSNQSKVGVMKKMVALTDVLATELRSGNINALGEILHEGWCLKSSISTSISNSHIQNYYEKAIQNGALGGKLLGAGGGGFLLFYVPESKQSAVRAALSDLREMPFNMESMGSEVIFYYE